MEVTLKLNMDEPEDQKSLDRIMKATHMAIVLWEINNNIKKEVERKIESNPTPQGQDYRYDGLDLFYESFYELMEEWDVNINNLID